MNRICVAIYEMSLQVGNFVITIFIFCFLKCSIQCTLSNAKLTLHFLISEGKSRVNLVQNVNRDLLLFSLWSFNVLSGGPAYYDNTFSMPTLDHNLIPNAFQIYPGLGLISRKLKSLRYNILIKSLLCIVISYAVWKPNLIMITFSHFMSASEMHLALQY